MDRACCRNDGDVVSQSSARFGSTWARDLLRTTSTAEDLDVEGRWAVRVEFEGGLTAAQFAIWSNDDPLPAGRWTGPHTHAWHSSLSRDAYCAAVDTVRDAIARGDVYQVNVCRVLRAAMPSGTERDIAALDRILMSQNPAPYGGYLDVPGAQIACASPELFLSVRWIDGRRIVRSGPIKGTGRTEADLQEKDTAENVMIVDLVRNDLSRICRTGTVHVPELLHVEHHPGLVHLVSYVEGELVDGCTWEQILAATFPPGSVTGAPKKAALGIIDDLETAPRADYCGAFGWIDADSGEAELAVAIRTFWLEGDELCFGTGAGITWGSDAAREWDETQLKAERLVQAAAGTWPMSADVTRGSTQ